MLCVHGNAHGLLAFNAAPHGLAVLGAPRALDALAKLANLNAAAQQMTLQRDSHRLAFAALPIFMHRKMLTNSSMALPCNRALFRLAANLTPELDTEMSAWNI